MTAYVVVNFTVTNPAGLAEYRGPARASLLAHGAEILAVDVSSEPLEGEPGHVTVIVRFDSKDAARAWYDSEDYKAVRPLRLNNSRGTAVICEGFPSLSAPS
jgi:uncharacterized protein (DUF1330 family)